MALPECDGGHSLKSEPEMRGPLQVVLISGQSNAGQGGVGVTLESRPLQPRALQFAGEGKALYGDRLQPAALDEIEPVADGSGGQYVQTMLGLALGAMGGDYLLHTSWWGNQPVGSFMPGGANFSNMLRAASASREVASALGFEARCDWLVWIQGESGPPGRALYASELSGYASAALPSVAEALGQPWEPKLLIVQTNSHDSLAGLGYDLDAVDSIALGQWDASCSIAGARLAGPMYHAPMIVDPADRIHTSSIGRMVLAEMLADAMSRGADWRPLQPLQATVQGRVVDVRFALPAGPLGWDTTWVKAAPHGGFSFRDASGAKLLAVDIVAADTVRLTLSSAPSPGAELRYALGVADDEIDGWASGRGQLMSLGHRASYFRSLGYDVPAQVNHYAVRFAVPVPWEAGR